MKFVAGFILGSALTYSGSYAKGYFDGYTRCAKDVAKVVENFKDEVKNILGGKIFRDENEVTVD